MEDDPPAAVPEWVVTYGDMMSLLLTFFIMLVSMSEMKKEGDMRALLDSVTQNFGNSPSMLSGVPGPSMQQNSAYRHSFSAGTRSEGGLKKANRNSGGPGGSHKTVRRINHGNNTTIGGPVFFADYSTELTPEVTENLDVIVKIIGQKPNRVMIRGHVSPVPIPPDSPYPTPLSLSFQRAKVVADYLASKGIDRKKMVINAAGDSEPRALSRNQNDLVLNHRVDVFLIESYILPQ
jgi:chemotaxis protein MotB